MHRLKTTGPVGYVVTIAMMLLACSFLFGFGEARPAPQTDTAFRPFVLHQQTLDFSSDMTAPPKRRDSTIARRSDGSRMNEDLMPASDSPNGQGTLLRQFWDVTGRRSVLLEPFTMSVMTQYLSDSEIANYLSSEHGCSDLESSESSAQSAAARSISTMLGHAVVQVEDSDAHIKATSWVAPDLDCYPLKRTLWFLDLQGEYQQTTVRDIVIGEPPDSMFDVGKDYTERSPSQVEAEYMTRFPGHELFGTQLSLVESQYEAHR